jgi:putative MFS transporter
VGRRRMLLWTFLVMALAFGAIALFPGAPTLVLFVALALYAVTSGSCNFIEIIYPNELFPTEIRATATGVVTAASRTGSATSTFLLPLLLADGGLVAVMWLLAAVNVVGLLVTLTLAEETRGRALSEVAGTTARQPAHDRTRAAHDAVAVAEPARAR